MRIMRIGPVAILAACALGPVLAGCGGETAAPPAASAPATAARLQAPPDGSSPASGQMLAGGGLGVKAVLADTSGEPLAVYAYLVVQPDGSARLCDALAESFPPGCGGDSIAVTGLPTELVDGLSADSGRRWSERPVQLIGMVRAGVFVNDPVALAAS